MLLKYFQQTCAPCAHTKYGIRPICPQQFLLIDLIRKSPTYYYGSINTHFLHSVRALTLL